MGYSSGRYSSSLNTPPSPSVSLSMLILYSVKMTHPRMGMIQAQIQRRQNDGDSLHLVQPRFRVVSRTLNARSPVCVKMKMRDAVRYWFPWSEGHMFSF